MDSIKNLMHNLVQYRLAMSSPTPPSSTCLKDVPQGSNQAMVFRRQATEKQCSTTQATTISVFRPAFAGDDTVGLDTIPTTISVFRPAFAGDDTVGMSDLNF
jgi:hypothetical protein